MSAAHTPGPWRVETWQIGEAKIDQMVITTSDRAIAYVKGSFPPDAGRLVSDARLIAAAPDMLAALRAGLAIIETATVRARKYGCPDKDAEAVEAQIRAAIAKAEGQS